MFAGTERFLEHTIKEIERYKATSLFSEKEIKSIIERRRAFEYALGRRTRTVEDYTKYIRYEAELGSIKNRRMASKEVSDSFLEKVDQGRIEFLFRRALKIFPTDVELWKRQFSYHRKMKNSDRAVDTGLAMVTTFPRNAELWMDVASYVVSDGDLITARVLLQRALRVVKEKEKANILLLFLAVEVENVYAEGAEQGSSFSIPLLIVEEIRRLGGEEGLEGEERVKEVAEEYPEFMQVLTATE